MIVEFAGNIVGVEDHAPPFLNEIAITYACMCTFTVQQHLRNYYQRLRQGSNH